ncbi:MAG TPA: chorismate mutase, partial [Desulfobacter sp.]|nr:chorismate mutase [Desulfobacter sp.]
MTKDNFSFEQQIKPLRDEIDAIDARIISLLSQRREQVEKIVAVKKEHKVPIYHPAREEDVISRLREKASDMDVDPDLVENLYRTIMHQSRKSQTRVSKT